MHELNKNLLLLASAAARGMKVEINSDGCTVYKRGRIIATGMRCGMLFKLNVEEVPQCHVVDNKDELWHRRLDHVSYSTVNKLITDGCITGKCMDPKVVCDICATAKQVRKSFNNTEADAEARESRRLDSIICSDVLGPISPASRSDYRYVATFMMMKSRYAMIFPLRKKSYVNKAFQ